MIKKGVNEGDYKNEENKIVIKDVLDRLLTSYEKRVIRARKSAQKSRDKKKAEKAKELEQGVNDENPTLTTELIADPPTNEQVEKQVEQQVKPQAEQ